MRTSYLIAYDVADPKRLRRVYHILKGAGAALQYSVFLCELNALEKQVLQERLWEILNLAEDRLLLANLGPAQSRNEDKLECWGQSRENLNDHQSIVF